MTYYKGTYNFACDGFRFEVGETYFLANEPSLSESSEFYCYDNPDDTLICYPPDPSLVILEVEPVGLIIKRDKSYYTDAIKIVRVLPREEWNSTFKNLIVSTDENGVTTYRHIKETGEIIYQFNADGKELYYKGLNGYEEWRKYDENGKILYCTDSMGRETREKEYDEFEVPKNPESKKSILDRGKNWFHIICYYWKLVFFLTLLFFCGSFGAIIFIAGLPLSLIFVGIPLLILGNFLMTKAAEKMWDKCDDAFETLKKQIGEEAAYDIPSIG